MAKHKKLERYLKLKNVPEDVAIMISSNVHELVNEQIGYKPTKFRKV